MVHCENLSTLVFIKKILKLNKQITFINHNSILVLIKNKSIYSFKKDSTFSFTLIGISDTSALTNGSPTIIS